MNPILHKILLFALFLNVATWANAAEYDFSVDGFEYKKLSETEVEVSGYSGDKTIITIRDWISSGWEKYQVIKIGDYAFRNSKITHVTIYGVKDIGKYAFQNCTELTSITIPKTVKSVGVGAFDECRKLSWVEITNLSKWLEIDFGDSDWHSYVYGDNPMHYAKCLILRENEQGERIINDVTELPSYYLEGITKLGNRSLYGFKNLEKLTIPKNIQSIGYRALKECPLKSLTILGACHIYEYNIDATNLDLTLNQGCRIGDYWWPNEYNFFKISDVSSTHSTATFTISTTNHLHIIDDNGNPAPLQCYSSKGKYSWDNGILKIWNVAPDTRIEACAFGGAIDYVDTKQIDVTFKLEKSYADKLVVSANINSGDYTFTNEEMTWKLDKDVISKSKTCVISFIPKASEVIFGIYQKDPYYYKNWTYEFSFPRVEISNVRAQATSYTSARLSAEMNLSTGAIGGIEWRRNDAPDNVQSNQVEAPIVDGKLLGELRGLRDDVYYKFRPYFDRGDGVTYGEWVGFYTGDAGVYFDPEVGTLTATANATSATMSGYVVAGSDNVTGRGFEYRPEDTSSRSDEWTRIEAKGTYMTTTADGLQPGTKYTYRAYAQTADKTYYGSEMSFTTEALSGIEDIAAESPSDELSVQLRENPVNGQPVIRVSNSDGEMAQCRIISISGRIVYDAPIATTGDYETLDVYLERGIYILQLTTTKQMKTIKLLAR